MTVIHDHSHSVDARTCQVKADQTYPSRGELGTEISGPGVAERAKIWKNEPSMPDSSVQTECLPHFRAASRLRASVPRSQDRLVLDDMTRIIYSHGVCNTGPLKMTYNRLGCAGAGGSRREPSSVG